MTTVTKTVYLIATTSPNSGDPFTFISTSDMEGQSDCVVAAQKEVSFDEPSMKEVSISLVAGLQEKKLEMQATATAAINEVEGQIQSLLALENQGEEA